MENKIWANLLHLSYSMWEDRRMPGTRWDRRSYFPHLRFDDSLWNDLLKEMHEAGLNMVIIDVGDGIEYQSHPELATKNAWSLDHLESELGKCRELGLEPIPKLNFSTAHDVWLGEYSRMVSTKAYYEVVADVIKEVYQLFGKPRFFHLGMDEETPGHQVNYLFLAVRQFELWWHDFYHMVDQVEKNGARPWIWSDYIWHHRAEFLEKMPKTVLQSNWYYGEDFNPSDPERKIRVGAYDLLEEHGFDQLPTASNHSNDVNFDRTVDYCASRVDDSRLLGFVQAPWRVTLEEFRDHHMEAVRQVGVSKRKHSV